MGHASPAANQARQGQVPDGICCVVSHELYLTYSMRVYVSTSFSFPLKVGTCASGFGATSPQAATLRPQARNNDAGDLIYTNSDMNSEYSGGKQQYFWEVSRNSIAELFEISTSLTSL